MRSYAVAAFAIALCGCTSLPRLDTPPYDAGTVTSLNGFPTSIRFGARDVAAMQAHFTSRRVSGCIDVLALSGGGSGGAFSAGILAGLTRGGARPQFDVVTGVSTGALAAPFAFAGSAWDSQIKDAFTGGWSDKLLGKAGVRSLFGSAVFQGRPLRNLIARFITPELLTAVAAQARSGRVLLVATTNLDAEETIIWDLGLIAETGGDRALRLFRDVLAASASAPGALPPIMIRVAEAGVAYDEMHVDGGVTIPFIVPPLTDTTAQTRTAASDCSNYFVIINSNLSDRSATTKRSALAISRRSLNTLMNQTVQSELLRIGALAHLRGATFKFTAVPRAYDLAASADFDQATMARLFAYGEACAAAGTLWTSNGIDPQDKALQDLSTCPAGKRPQ